MVQVVKKGLVQLQNRLVPDGPVHEWVRRIDDLQPDIDRVLQVPWPWPLPLPLPVRTVQQLAISRHLAWIMAVQCL